MFTSMNEQPASLIYVLYHANCVDGKGAHYAAWKKFGASATYIAAHPNQPVPDIPIGEHVSLYILDLSYPAELLVDLNAVVGKLMVIDHHPVSRDSLTDTTFAIYDEEKSAAVLSWMYFHPEIEIPILLMYIQDLVLDSFKMSATMAVVAGINSFNSSMDEMELWDLFANDIDALVVCIKRGKHYLTELERHAWKYTESDSELVKITQLDGYKIAVYNTNEMINDLGRLVCLQTSHNVDFSLSYYIAGNGNVILNFRTIEEKCINMSKITKKYGGSGHVCFATAVLNAESGMRFLTQLYSQV